ARVRPAVSWRDYRDGSDRRVEIEIRHASEELGVRREVLVAQTEVEAQVGLHAPIVLHEPVEAPASEVITLPAGLQRTRLRQSEEEVGETVAGAFQRIVNGDEHAGEQSAEAERATRVRVAQRVLLLAAIA